MAHTPILQTSRAVQMHLAWPRTSWYKIALVGWQEQLVCQVSWDAARALLHADRDPPQAQAANMTSDELYTPATDAMGEPCPTGVLRS
jgi:hypothetical protein